LKILFVPHESFETYHRQREHYLIEELQRNNEIHIILWTDIDSTGDLLRISKYSEGLKRWDRNSNGILLHHIRRIMGPPQLLSFINQSFFRNALRRIIESEKIEAVIFGPSELKIGFPSKNFSVPMIFDCGDYFRNRKHLMRYLEVSDAVLCPSKYILRDVAKYHDKTFLVPNGADIERMSKGDRGRIRNHLGIDDNTKVIGLIGLTVGSSLFFLESTKYLKERIDNFVFLLVGRSRRIAELKTCAEVQEAPIIFTDQVPYDKINDYFAAIDVGIYPVDQNPYFDSAIPIKILEYTAAGKPVVSTDIEEMRSLGFQNVFLCKPTARDFSIQIEKALNYNGEFPSLSRYEWKTIAHEIEDIIKSLI
jgi:glycosyltransferase involved in cell wall biosynthesis